MSTNTPNKPQMRWLPKQKQPPQVPSEANSMNVPNSFNSEKSNNSTEKKDGNFVLYSVPPPPDASAAFSSAPNSHPNFVPFILPNPTGVPLSQHQNLDQIKDQIFSLLTSSSNKQNGENENVPQRTLHSLPPSPFTFGNHMGPFMQFNNMNMPHPGVIGHIPFQQPGFPNHFPPFSYPYQFPTPPVANQNNFPVPNFANFNFQNINPAFLQSFIPPEGNPNEESADEALLNDLKRQCGEEANDNNNIIDDNDTIQDDPIDKKIDQSVEINNNNTNNSNNNSNNNIQDSPQENINNNVSGNSPFCEIIDEKKKVGQPPDYTLNGIYHTVHSRKVLEKYAANCEKNYGKISKTIETIFEEIRPPKDDMARRKELLKRVQALISDYWPNDNAKLHLFGSSANDFCLKGGDIDMCLTIDRKDDQKVEVVEDLGRLLVKHQMENVVSLSAARVPIVKFKDPKTGYSCDICINNILALENTRLLAYYAKIDPRLKKLACVIKYWAKRRQINAPFAGTLSSYAYVLLLIHFLQRRDPPILPCLQLGIDNIPKVEVEGYDCTYQTNNLNINRLNGSKNKQPLGKLLVDFYKFYGLEFDYVNCVISVRTGGYFTKETKDWKRPKHNRESCFLGLEDPFEVTHNLGRVVDKRGIEIIRNEFERAFIILARKGDFKRVTKEYSEDDQDCNWR